MRYLLVIIILIAGTEFSNAQTSGSTDSSNKKKRQATRLTREQRGTGQYHGSRDTTPGSPMGTGGAGGGMGGSREASAIGTNDQTSREANRDTMSVEADTILNKQTEGAPRTP